MRLVILGGAGAGKGTQARRLSIHLNVPAISTGDILRGAIVSYRNLRVGLFADRPQVERSSIIKSI